MQVVSGAMGKENIHFEAPDAGRLEEEMRLFIHWFNEDKHMDPVIKAAVAHLWFVTIHPFDDGNGRIARAIADMQLSRADESAQRFYSMSAQIRKERKDYYEILESTQKGSMDITNWLTWFLQCLDRALDAKYRSERHLQGAHPRAAGCDQGSIDVPEKKQFHDSSERSGIRVLVGGLASNAE